MSISVTDPMSRAKGMLTRQPRKFDKAAAATIEVSLCLRMATVIVEIATIMKQARPIPL